MPDIVWAKSTGITLCEHIADLVRVFEELEKFLEKYPFWQESQLRALLHDAVFCHDFGKVQPAFQRKLGNRGYRPTGFLEEIPHSLASLFFLNWETLTQRIGKEQAPLFLSAVAFHHFRGDFLEYLGAENARLRRFCLRLLEDETLREELLGNLYGTLSNCQESEELLGFNEKLARAIVNGLSLSDFFPLPYLLEGFPSRIGFPEEQERFFILLGGFLKRCDHFASFCEGEGEWFLPEKEGLAKEELWKVLTGKLKEQAKTGTLWQEIYLQGCGDENLILVAPTGYGKTEFAFLWSGGEKFFYTLPLRTAVNQTHRRAENLWGKENVALLHADADLFFLERDSEGSSRTYDLSRQLSLPVCVATGDQFFPYALRPPGYERIYATFAYARLVIDEVQAYEPQAAAIIVKFTEDIVKMGGRYLLMTATLPEFVKEEIQKRTKLDGQHCINLYEKERKRFDSIKKHVVTSLSGVTMELLVQKIIEEAEFDSGQRVLVVVNTVNKAQELYENLCATLQENPRGNLRDKVWLFHSRFTLEDRRKKENILETEFANPKDAPDGAKILVATQVVEASLNIDADVLFTELAPMDALIQRMGRVLRRIGPQCNPCDNGGYVTPDGKHYRVSHEKPNVYLLVFSKEQDENDIAPYLPEPMHATAWIFNQLFSKESLPDSVPKELIDLFKSAGKKPKRSAKTAIDLKNGTKILSEYEKFHLVSLLYQFIAEADGEYLHVFYKTLALLDSGYVSSRKREAQEVFRKISDISAIPEENLPQFLQEVVDFFEAQRSTNRGKPTYTEFKRDILSRYLVNVPWAQGKGQLGGIPSLPDSLSPLARTLLGDWLQGVFVVSGSYDAQCGFRYQKRIRA